MDCSTPGFLSFTISQFAQTHVHWEGDAIQPSHPLLPPSPESPALITLVVMVDVKSNPKPFITSCTPFLCNLILWPLLWRDCLFPYLLCIKLIWGFALANNMWWKPCCFSFGPRPYTFFSFSWNSASAIRASPTNCCRMEVNRAQSAKLTEMRSQTSERPTRNYVTN